MHLNLIVMTLGILILLKKFSIFNPSNKYIYWLIFKFTFIAKKAKFIPEQLAKMIIRDSIIAQKKEVFTKILYN